MCAAPISPSIQPHYVVPMLLDASSNLPALSIGGSNHPFAIPIKLKRVFKRAALPVHTSTTNSELTNILVVGVKETAKKQRITPLAQDLENILSSSPKATQENAALLSATLLFITPESRSVQISTLFNCNSRAYIYFERFVEMIPYFTEIALIGDIKSLILFGNYLSTVFAILNAYVKPNYDFELPTNIDDWLLIYPPKSAENEQLIDEIVSKGILLKLISTLKIYRHISPSEQTYQRLLERFLDHPRGDVHLRKIMFDLANDSDFISPQFVKALNEITIPPSFRESFYSTILPSALLLSSDFQYLGSTLSWNFLIDLLCRITDEVPPYSSSVGLYLNPTLEVGLQKKLKWMNFFHPDRERFYHHLCQLSSDEHLTLARSALSLEDHQRKSSMNVVISALLHSVNYKSIPNKFQKIVELMLTQGHSAILGERINQGFDALSQIALIKFPDLPSQEQHESMIFFSYTCFITDITLQHQILSLMIDQLNLRSSWVDDLKRLIHTYTSNKNLFRKQKGFITLLHKYITDKQRHPEIQKIAKEVLPELGRLIRLGTDK